MPLSETPCHSSLALVISKPSGTATACLYASWLGLEGGNKIGEHENYDRIFVSYGGPIHVAADPRPRVGTIFEFSICKANSRVMYLGAHASVACTVKDLQGKKCKGDSAHTGILSEQDLPDESGNMVGRGRFGSVIRMHYEKL